MATDPSARSETHHIVSIPAHVRQRMTTLYENVGALPRPKLKGDHAAGALLLGVFPL